MNVLRLPGTRVRAAIASGVLVVGAVALAGLAPGGEPLAALPSFFPGEARTFELLLFGCVGVVIGRLTIWAESSADRREAQATTRQKTDANKEKIDRVLRYIAKVLQVHLSDSETFSKRLDGANERLSQQHAVGPVHEIVLALIEDNREMRNKLYSVRSELEESRLRVMHLQTNLERAEEAGMRDFVTEVGNRRFFDASFAVEVERARKAGGDFCLALADIDRFKHVNDRFGHLVGDRLLRLFAKILVQNVRGQDKVARFGGEEFALMLPGARLVEAVGVVERIRGILESKQWTVESSGERVGKVTASFGVARLRTTDSGADLIERADQRLYEAKVQGRNRVVSDSADDDASTSPRPARPCASSG